MTTWRFYYNLLNIEREMCRTLNHISWETLWIEWHMWRNC
jgi:hypothetical protein